MNETTKSILVIQSRPKNSNRKWLDCFSWGETLDEVREELQESKSHNPDLSYRIIQRVTAVSENPVESYE